MNRRRQIIVGLIGLVLTGVYVLALFADREIATSAAIGYIGVVFTLRVVWGVLDA